MKIGLITGHVSSRAGGLWISVPQLGKALARLGLDVEIFGIADAHSENHPAGWDGPPLRLHDVFGSGAFGYAPGLGPTLDARRPSLLHANGLWMYPSLASARWSRRTRRPYLICPRGMLDPWAVRNAAWKKRLVSWWFENAHLAGAACLHALTHAEARAIRAYGLSNPICVIPNGIDVPEDRQPPAPVWADLLGGRQALLFLGRLHPKKGLVNLVRAWAAVQRHPRARDWALVIAGWDQGGHERDLSNLVEQLSLDRSVLLVGPQFHDTKAASFSVVDAFILPSVSEGLPMAVLEAWAHRLPVLMTPACNLPEGFASGAALQVEPDVGGLAQGLRDLFAMSDAKRADMGVRGQALVRERFAWRSVGERMAAVYQWVLGRGSPPACVLTD